MFWQHHYCLWTGFLLVSLVSAHARPSLRNEWCTHLPGETTEVDTAVVSDPDLDLVVVSSSKGAYLTAYSARNGSALWNASGIHENVTPGPRAPVQELIIDNDRKLVFVLISGSNVTLLALDAGTGRMVYLVPPPPNMALVGLSQNLLVVTVSMASSPANFSGIVTFNLTTGLQVWSRTYSPQRTTIFQTSGLRTGSSFVALVGFSTNGTTYVASFDLSTGDLNCVFENAKVDLTDMQVQVAGDLFVGQTWEGSTSQLYNASRPGTSGPPTNQTGPPRCESVLEIPWNSQNVDVTADGGSFYVLDGAGSRRIQSTLSRYVATQPSYHGRLTAAWSTAIGEGCNPNGYVSVGHVEISGSGRGILLNVAGRFTALDEKDGTEVWNTRNVTTPFGPGQEVAFPFARHLLLVPNLQGWVVLDTRNGGAVVSRNEHDPVIASGRVKTVQAGLGSVVFLHPRSGRLCAVSLQES